MPKSHKKKKNLQLSVQSTTPETNEQKETIQNEIPECKLKKDSNKKKKADVSNTAKFIPRNANRTRVPEYVGIKMYIEKKLDKDPNYKYWILSRSYFRKLSEEVHPHECKNQRKISWSDQIQVVFFDKKKNAQTISQKQRLKENIDLQICLQINKLVQSPGQHINQIPESCSQTIQKPNEKKNKNLGNGKKLRDDQQIIN